MRYTYKRVEEMAKERGFELERGAYGCKKGYSLWTNEGVISEDTLKEVVELMERIGASKPERTVKHIQVNEVQGCDHENNCMDCDIFENCIASQGTNAEHYHSQRRIAKEIEEFGCTKEMKARRDAEDEKASQETQDIITLDNGSTYYVTFGRFLGGNQTLRLDKVKDKHENVYNRERYYDHLGHLLIAMGKDGKPATIEKRDMYFECEVYACLEIQCTIKEFGTIQALIHAVEQGQYTREGTNVIERNDDYLVTNYTGEAWGVFIYKKNQGGLYGNN